MYSSGADLPSTPAAGSRARQHVSRHGPASDHVASGHTSYIRCRPPIPHQNSHRAISPLGIYAFGWTQVHITLQRRPAGGSRCSQVISVQSTHRLPPHQVSARPMKPLAFISNLFLSFGLLVSPTPLHSYCCHPTLLQLADNTRRTHPWENLGPSRWITTKLEKVCLRK